MEDNLFRPRPALRFALVASLLSLLIQIPRPAAADSRAQAVVDAMEAALRRPAWEKVRYLRFDFLVERDSQKPVRVRHLWDKARGLCRIEWREEDGRAVAAFLNSRRRSGRVFLDGKKLAGAERAKYLEAAYKRFINDGYWLLAPFKLKDPGARVEWVGEASVDGGEHDVLHVSFEQVGLTPGDHYWYFVNRRTHRPDRWAYSLQGFGGERSLENAWSWAWRDWTEAGGAFFSRERLRTERDWRISFPGLAAPGAVDRRAFKDPRVPMPEFP